MAIEWPVKLESWGDVEDAAGKFIAKDQFHFSDDDIYNNMKELVDAANLGHAVGPLLEACRQLKHAIDAESTDVWEVAHVAIMVTGVFNALGTLDKPRPTTP